MKIEINNNDTLVNSVNSDTRYLQINGMEVLSGIPQEIDIRVHAQFVGIQANNYRDASHGVGLPIDEIPKKIDLYEILERFDYSHLKLEKLILKTRSEHLSRVVLNLELLENKSDNPQNF